MARALPVRRIADDEAKSGRDRVRSSLCTLRSAASAGTDVASNHDADAHFYVQETIPKGSLSASPATWRGRSILAPAWNHWYHMDMAYRGIINMPAAAVNGGWSHYGRRKTQAADLGRRSPSRLDRASAGPGHEQHLVFFGCPYHSWRYETLEVPLPCADGTLIDYTRARLRDGLASLRAAAFLNPLGLAAEPKKACSRQSLRCLGARAGEIWLRLHRSRIRPTGRATSSFGVSRGVTLLKHPLVPRTVLQGKYSAETGRQKPRHVHPGGVTGRRKGKLIFLVTL